MQFLFGSMLGQAYPDGVPQTLHANPDMSAGMQDLQSVNLQGCRNVISPPGEALPLLQRLTALTSLVLRNCDGLQDEALATTALASLHHLDLSGVWFGRFHFFLSNLR